MELLFEFLVELLTDGVVEASKSKKVPKPIRYFLIVLIALSWLVLVVGVFVLGVLMLNHSKTNGVVIILIGVAIAFISVKKFIKTYVGKKKELQEQEKF